MKIKNIELFRKKFLKLANKSDSFILSTHMGADDDAIASLLALDSFLKTKYPQKKTRMIISEAINDRWSYFQNFRKISYGRDLAEQVNTDDLVVLLDGNRYHRFSQYPDVLKGLKNPKVCVDHHGGAPDKFNLSLIDHQATSTSELLYRLFFDGKKINQKTAETLMMGIIGDTGGFRYLDRTKSQIFRIAEALVTKGNIDIDSLRHQ